MKARIMRRLAFFLALALSLSACKKETAEEPQPQPEPVVYDLTSEMSNPDTAELEFMKDWEKFEQVPINKGGSLSQESTPWSTGLVKTALPTFLCHDVKKDGGWEMAFCYLDGVRNDVNFFGLYNRWTGILRVYFWYIPNQNATSASFEVDMGSASIASDKYPLYNMLGYAIPSCHKNLRLNEAFFTGGAAYTYKSFVTPSKISSSTAMNEGWTCIDIDMSAYNPNPAGWPTDPKDRMMISVMSEKTEQLQLKGIVSAKTSGKFSGDFGSAQSSSSDGLSSFFGGISKTGQSSAFIFELIKKFTGKDVSVIGTVINAVGKVGSFISEKMAKALSSSSISPSAVIDSLPGRIVLNTEGKMDLTGYIQSFIGSAIPTVTFAPNVTGSSEHFGRGVWSLAEDPVICVFKNVMMGDEERLNLMVPKTGCYFNNEIMRYNLRIAQYLDPNSIKVNLNTDIFPHPDSVRVLYCYGVYTNAPSQSVKQYLDFMGNDRPTIPIVSDGAKYYSSLTPGNNIKYVNLTKEELICDELEETLKTCKLTEETVGIYRYRTYGNTVTSYGRPFIPEPQVLFPIGQDPQYGLSTFDAQMPDFVLLVTVLIKSDGKWFRFSNRFLPKIKLVEYTSRSGMSTMIDELESYSNKCKNGQPAGTLANDSSIPVYHPIGDRNAKKSLNMLKKIKYAM